MDAAAVVRLGPWIYIARNDTASAAFVARATRTL